MKRNIILSVFLAFILVLAFTACSGTGSDDDPYKENPPSVGGGTITASGDTPYINFDGEEFEMTEGLNINFTHLIFEFGGGSGDSNEEASDSPAEPPIEPSIIIPFARAAEEDDFDEGFKLSDVISGNPVAEIKNGKVNISIGKPKNAALKNLGMAFAVFGDIPSDVTISAPDAKIFLYNTFVAFINYKKVFGSMTSKLPDGEGPIGMMYAKSETEKAAFIYVDKDVKVSGSVEINYEDDDGIKKGTMIWDINAKAGWNMLFLTFDEKNHKQYFETGNSTNGFKWFIGWDLGDNEGKAPDDISAPIHEGGEGDGGGEG